MVCYFLPLSVAFLIEYYPPYLLLQVGRERQITFSLMQKFIDLHNFGSKLQIVSVFTLDHVKGYVYIEADKAYDVSEVGAW